MRRCRVITLCHPPLARGARPVAPRRSCDTRHPPLTQGAPLRTFLSSQLRKGAHSLFFLPHYSLAGENASLQLAGRVLRKGPPCASQRRYQTARGTCIATTICPGLRIFWGRILPFFSRLSRRRIRCVTYSFRRSPGSRGFAYRETHPGSCRNRFSKLAHQSYRTRNEGRIRPPVSMAGLVGSG